MNIKHSPTLFDDIEKMLSKTSIGTDEFLRKIRSSANTIVDTYPPFNIEQVDEDNYVIVLALAGFTKGDLTITQEKDVLFISGKSQNDGTITGSGDITDPTRVAQYIHRGIAMRDFDRKFQLGEYIKVKDATMENGLLTVTLKRVVPKADKAKTIAIK